MSTRFRRTVKIAPGVRFNLGKRGSSITVGSRLGRVTAGPRTRVGTSVPGAPAGALEVPDASASAHEEPDHTLLT